MSDSDHKRPVRSFRDLDVWQRAMTLSRAVYDVSKEWPADERFGLTSQARRAVVSIAANIAEGHGRYGRNEFARFVAIANGSLCELETLVELSHDLDFIQQSEFESLARACRDLGNMLNALYRSLSRPKSD